MRISFTLKTNLVEKIKGLKKMIKATKPHIEKSNRANIKKRLPTVLGFNWLTFGAPIGGSGSKLFFRCDFCATCPTWFSGPSKDPMSGAPYRFFVVQ